MGAETVPEYSVIILCYRSEASILEFARKTKATIEKHTSSFEIVLVGNYLRGSEDKTKDYIKILEKEDPIYVGIYIPKDGMMGWDMKEGLKIAKGKYLCVIDGDGQFPISSVGECYDIIKTGEYGLVKTFRTARADGSYRKTISKVYNFLFTILFPNVKSRDINSKPKLMTRDCYNQLDLQSDDWFIDAEIMIKAGRLGIPIYELPVVFSKLEGRSSFVKPRAIIEFIRNLIYYRYKK